MRNTGNPLGDLTGFYGLDMLYTIKQGSFTFILAAPHHGKSEFAFELAFNQAHKYGKKSLIYSPETGSVEDIYAEFTRLTGLALDRGSIQAADSRGTGKVSLPFGSRSAVTQEPEDSILRTDSET